MIRTFHSRPTFSSLLPPFLSAAVALWLLWQPTAGRTVMGVAMIVLTIFTVERIVHTQYVLTDDGRLIVSHGRFSGRRTIALTDITSVERFERRLLQPEYVLIKYGTARYVVLCPENSTAFVAELKKRQKR